MKEMTKNIKISFDVDKVKYREVDKLMRKLGKNLELVDDADVKKLEEMMGKFKENEFRIDGSEAKEVLAQLEKLRQRGFLNKDDLKVFKRESAFEQFGKGFKGEMPNLSQYNAEWLGAKSAELLTKTIKKVGEEIKDTLIKSYEKLNELLDYSRMTNKTTRENLFTYGMSASESYGLERAMTFVGIDDLEDVIWLQADQQKAFQEKLLQETQRYQKLYDSGYFEKMQQYQWDMQNFRDEVEYDFMNFFVNNKETIMQALQLVAGAAKTGVQLLGVLVQGLVGRQTLSDEDRAARTKEMFYAGTGLKGSNVNVNIDNTFNNVAHSDQTWLANAGEMTYEQLIRALSKGGVIS